MVGPERHRSPELLTKEGSQALRERQGVLDILAENRWLATFVAGLIPGTIVACALLLGGVSVGLSLIGGAAVVLSVIGGYAIASAIVGRPLIPDLFPAENEPGELLESERWGSESAAAAAARSRNLKDGPTGSYWIEVRVGRGSWGIERRRYRPGAGGDGDFADGDYGGWFGDGGGGGGDGGGGG